MSKTDELIKECEEEYEKALQDYRDAKSDDEKEDAKEEMDYWTGSRMEYIKQKHEEEKIVGVQKKNEAELREENFREEYPLLYIISNAHGGIAGLSGTLIKVISDNRINKRNIDARTIERREIIEFTEKGLIPDRQTERFLNGK